MMKQLKKLAALFLVVCLLVSTVPGASAASSYNMIEHAVITPDNPDSLVVRLRTNCKKAVLAAALYDEDGRMLSTEMTSVRGPKWGASLLDLPKDRPASFDLKVFLLDGETYEPLCESYYLENAGDVGNYAITALRTDGSSITAEVSTSNACRLVIHVRDSEGGLIFSTSLEAAAELEMENLSVEITEPLPTYYTVEAVLQDEYDYAISSPFVDRTHTEAHQKFAALTEADFADSTVLDYGEADDGNFAVLKDDVRLIECSPSRNTLVSTTDSTYTFANAGEELTALQAGDRFCFLSPEGEHIAVKVVTASVQDGTVVIRKDESAGIPDFFSTIKLNTALTYDAPAGESAQALLSAVPSQLTSIQYGQALSSDLTTPFGSVEGTIRAGGNISVTYCPEELGEEYMSVTCVGGVKGDISLTIGPSMHVKDELVLLSIPLFGLKNIGEIPLEFGLGYELDCETGYNTTYSYEQKFGFVYTTTEGMQTVRQKQLTQEEASVQSNVKGKLDMDIGLRFSLKAKLLKDLVEAGVGAEVGANVNAEISALGNVLPSGADFYHACALCGEGELKGYMELEITLDYHISDFLHGSLLDLDIVRVEWKIGEFYLSLLNDADSVHGGKAVFAWAEQCPNRKYQIKVVTLDADRKEVPGCQVTVAKGSAVQATFKSPGTTYLYPGTYLAQAEIGQNLSEAEFTVADATQTIYLSGEDNALSGRVTNARSGEGISGVTVEIRQDGAIVCTVTTDGDGYYSQKLPDGSYRAVFSAEGYEPKELDVLLENSKSLNPQLQPMAYTLSFAASGGEGSMDSMTFYADETITLPACGFTAPEEKIFTGWQIGGVRYDAGSSCLLGAGDQTAAAVWSDKLFTVTVTVLNADGSAASGLPIAGTGLSTAPVTGADGTVRFELPRGNYKLSATDANDNYDSGEISVTADTQLTLTLKVPEISWTLDETTGVLTITGDGPMPTVSTAWCDPLTKIKSVVLSGVTTISYGAFQNCTNLASVSIPESVTEIAGSAFYNCIRLREITIPEGVTTIGNNAFFNCDALTSETIHIPDTVTSIGSSAFEGCYGLESLPYLGSITEISEELFADCQKLKTIVIPHGVTTIGTEAFYRVISAESLTVPGSVTGIGVRAFYNCSNLTSVTLSEGLGAISSQAFDYCGALESISIPDSVTYISDHAFSNCTALKKAELPANLKKLSGYLFEDCAALTDITIPESVTSIDKGVFSGCSALTNIVISDGVTKLPEGVFSNCTALTSVTIPASVTDIQWAFTGCSALTDIYYGGSAEDWANITIYSTDECLASAAIHYNCTGN